MNDVQDDEEYGSGSLPHTAPAEVQPPSTRLLWVMVAVALASLGVALTLTRTVTDLRKQNETMRIKVTPLETQQAALKKTIAMLASTRVRVFDLTGQGENANASARLFVDASNQQSFFAVTGLRAAASGNIYQLWLIPDSGDAVSATTFNTGSDGSIAIEIPIPQKMTNVKSAAISLQVSGSRPGTPGTYLLSSSSGEK